MIPVVTEATRPIRAAANAVTFLIRVYPMLPSRPVDRLTTPPVIERVCYPTRVRGHLTQTKGISTGRLASAVGAAAGRAPTPLR